MMGRCSRLSQAKSASIERGKALSDSVLIHYLFVYPSGGAHE